MDHSPPPPHPMRGERPPVSAWVISFAVGVVLTLAIGRFKSAAPSQVEVRLPAEMTRTTDHNGDGAPDEWWHYVNGTATSAEEDRNRDGKPDAWQVYSDGGIREYRTDDDFDGVAESVVWFEKGLAVAGEIDEDQDGKADSRMTFANGVTVSQEWLDNKTGRVVKRVRFEADRRVYEEMDLDGDGVFERQESFGPLELPIPSSSALDSHN